MMKRIFAACTATMLLGVAVALASPLVSGIDRSGFDESTRPQDDFNQHVNGGWIDKTEIPADKTRWGSFDMLREASDKHQREIIEELAESKNLRKGSEE